MILAIDYDGTIHDDKNIPEGHRLGPPMPNTKEALEMFKNDGDTIIVFCVWATNEKNIETIVKWMDYFELPYDDITNVKPVCDFIIDDRAIRFTNWLEVLKQIK